ncbi:hypothetical protein C8F01DRAFT_1243452 [Mycena amicta]|nr:hypothetical protein C8F01DRAFT_1243452 [Mycena amicta]
MSFAGPLPPHTADNEQDLAGAHRWSDDEAEAEHLHPSSKGKARQTYPDDEDRPELQEYPPTTDDDADTRRIEENLRRWELAERAKRKAAREQRELPVVAGESSLLSNVVHRASTLLGRAPRPHDEPSRGAHTVLSSQENLDSVRLDDIAASPTPSPTHSEPSNPFSDANAEPPSTPQRPALLAASSSIRRPPTPKPLGLPPPRVLPPSSTPPVEPTQEDAEPKETRWWHEWLCGFGEGPDRGGHSQAGRTNPFE